MMRLTDQQVQHFRDEGYLIVRDVFDPAELEPLRREIAEQVDAKVRALAAEGKISDTYTAESFETRLAKIHADSEENGRAIIRHLEGVAGGGLNGPQMFALLTHPK